MEPDLISCVRLRSDAIELESLVRRQQEQAAAIQALQHEVTELASGLAPTMAATAFHSDQIKKLEEALGVLAEAYRESTIVVGKNNDQIGAVTSSLAAGLAEVRRGLDELKQKVDGIK